MGTGAITAYVDVAQVVLYAFWIFFFGLIYYLIRENHREGYPLDSGDRGTIEGWPPTPEPKTYRMADGREVQVPRDEAPQPIANAEPAYRGAAAPLQPVGNPLTAGVGPGAWSSLRPDVPDFDHDGAPKLAPLTLVPGCGVSAKDPDPRGMAVHDCNGNVAGVVRDLWLDRGEMLFRYLEVELGAANGATPSRRVLVPMPFASVTRRGIEVQALMAEQFAGVPAIARPDRVTLLEEERIGAYFGAGTLYAQPHRAEPLV
jgi:photosynthetic reaction center H subunit